MMSSTRHAAVARQFRTALAALLLLATLTAAPMPSRAQARGAADSATQVDDLVERVHGGLVRAFAVPADLEIDPELRSAATALVAKELPRIRRVLAGWRAEEVQRYPDAADDASLAFHNRTHNEMGLWLLDRDGPEHDRRLQAAYARARSCDFIRRQSSLFGEIVQAWQQVPLAQRADLLAAEARLLARWGTSRPMAPARPPESVSDRAQKMFAQHAEQGEPLSTPLPPISAWRLFAEDGRERERPDRERRCLARQWALQDALARSAGGLDAEAWTPFLYDRVFEAHHWFVLDEEVADTRQGYPVAASGLRIEGEIVMEFGVDAGGGVHDARIVRRDIKVHGIRGQRPVIFDTLLDAPTFARLKATPIPPPPQDQLTDGRRASRMSFAYTLDR